MKDLQGGKSRPAWPEIAVFVVAAVALCLANWPRIDMVHYEVSDFAANSLLIQDAKSLSLWVGHYSRVGFNHPGPALLYALALGELVLVDWTHALPSPLSGQMVAAFLFDAIWITLFYRGCRKLSGSDGFALAVTVTFLVIAAFAHVPFFTSLWFPELFFFPYAAMLVAVARFASGRCDMLLTLAASSGFLMNGHVSFVTTLGIIFMAALAYNRIVHAGCDASRTITSGPYWRVNKRHLAASLGVLSLFFLPLAVETFRHFPGPVASYLAFAHAHHPNSFLQSVQFSGLYWGGVGQFAAGLLAMIGLFVILPRISKKIDVENIRSSLIVLISASGAILFYAKFGVDILNQDYLGYFYYAVPALFVSLSVGCLYRIFDGRWARVSLAVLTLAAVSAIYQRIEAHQSDEDWYTRPDVVDLYDALAGLKSDRRIVLNLEGNNRGWGELWTTLVGVQLYAKRRDVDLFCIDRNWHVLFTVKARCTPDETAHDITFMVGRSPGSEKLVPTIDKAGLSFYKYPMDMSATGHFTIEHDAGVFEDFFLRDGWSIVEPRSVWMQAPEAHLSMKTGTGFSGLLELDLAAFLPRPDSVQKLSVSIDGAPAAQIIFDSGKPRQNIVIPLRDTAHDTIDIAFEDHDLVSPKAIGMSDDPRTLGIALFGFSLHP